MAQTSNTTLINIEKITKTKRFFYGNCHVAFAVEPLRITGPVKNKRVGFFALNSFLVVS